DRHGERSLLLMAGRALSADELRELQFTTGTQIELEPGDSAAVSQAIPAAYSGALETIAEHAEAANASAGKAKALRAADDPIESKEPVPLLLDGIIARADSLGASDIHLEPLSDGFRVRYRVAGTLERDEGLTVTSDTANQLLRRVKLLAKL